MKIGYSKKQTFQELITQIRGEQMERLYVEDVDVEDEHTIELLKELKGNESKELLIFCKTFCGTFVNVLNDVLKVNRGVRELAFYCYKGHKVGDLTIRGILEALKLNQFVKILYFRSNEIGEEGARAIADMLRVNVTLRYLDLRKNMVGADGGRALLDAVQVNGSLTECFVDEFQDEVKTFCKRNKSMHNRAAESVVHLLALRNTRRVLWTLREMMLMIGQMLWRTKCDIDAWNNHGDEREAKRRKN